MKAVDDVAFVHVVVSVEHCGDFVPVEQFFKPLSRNPLFATSTFAFRAAVKRVVKSRKDEIGVFVNLEIILQPIDLFLPVVCACFAVLAHDFRRHFLFLLPDELKTVGVQHHEMGGAIVERVVSFDAR